MAESVAGISAELQAKTNSVIISMQAKWRGYRVRSNMHSLTNLVKKSRDEKIEIARRQADVDAFLPMLHGFKVRHKSDRTNAIKREIALLDAGRDALLRDLHDIKMQHRTTRETELTWRRKFNIL